jgi:hypothetical protein
MAQVAAACGFGFSDNRVPFVLEIMHYVPGPVSGGVPPGVGDDTPEEFL